jgi:hypothetical protein
MFLKTLNEVAYFVCPCRDESLERKINAEYHLLET